MLQQAAHSVVERGGEMREQILSGVSDGASVF